MKNKLCLLGVLLTLMIVVFTGCAGLTVIKNDRELVSITFDNVPDGSMNIGEFDSYGICIRLHYSTGEDDVVPVYSSMFSEEYQDLLTKPGTHEIELLYRGLTARTTVTLREKACWTLTFLNWNDEVVKTQTFEEGEEQIVSYPSDAEMAVDGYAFTGEYTSFTLPITQNTTVKGIYDKAWTVVFYNGDNVAISTQQVRDGEAAVEPDASARAMEGFKFASWDIAFNRIVKNTNVYGIYYEVTTLPEEEGHYSTGLAFTSNGDGTCYVSGIGTCTDTDIVIPPTSPSGDVVTKIGSNAFESNTSLTSIIMPDSVTVVGSHAFFKCTNLTLLTLSNNLKVIEWGAFYVCTNLTSLNIPASLTSIETHAFSDCSNLSSIVVAEGNPVFHSTNNCLIETTTGVLVRGCKSSCIPTDGSINSIGYMAFSGCYDLSEISIPDSVTTIESSAFSRCTGLTNVYIPAGVTKIGHIAFEGCSGVVNVTVDSSNTIYHSAGNCIIETASKTLIQGFESSTIPMDGTVIHLGFYSFAWCSNLTEIVIPNCIQTIDSGSFIGCTSLTSIIYLGTEDEWNAITKGYDWDFRTGSYTVIFKQTLDFSEGLEYIVKDGGTCSVSGIGSCTDVELVIPGDYEGLTVVGIEPEAFAGCTFIISVTFPDTMKSIGEKAFEGCINLEIVNIPDSVEFIGNKAFSECESLRIVIIPDTALTGTDVFRGSIYVELVIKHNLVFVEAQAATCTAPGNVACYVCETCGEYYADAEGTTRLYDVIIPASHEFIDGVCIRCGTVMDSVRVVAIDSIPHLGKFAPGTMENAIGLPNMITVYTADGHAHDLPILWDLTGYDKSTVGEYVIRGHVQQMEFHFTDGLSTEISVGIEIVDYMEGTADIVFVLDISGSMGEEIKNVKNNIIAFAQAIEARGVSARWSVITFSDYVDRPDNPNEMTTIIQNGASDWFVSAEDYRNAISSIALANGGDDPETDIDGLMMASTLSTRKDARTFYILLTDATYKIDNHYGVESLQETADVLNEKGVNVSVITTTALQSTYAPLTDTTGGIWSNINGNFADDLLNELVPIIYSTVVD